MPGYTPLGTLRILPVLARCPVLHADGLMRSDRALGSEGEKPVGEEP